MEKSISTNAVEVENISKKFRSLTAVDGISLKIKKGEIFGIVGPDGAGKSTLMRMLVSILTPSGGEGWVGGHHIVHEADAVKKKIGYMSQRFGLYGDLTVLENLNFYADIFDLPRGGREAQIAELLAFSQLTPFSHRRADQLSGGMKQKLGLACTLIHRPEILFLDEPTNGVDPVSRRDFWRILYDLHRGGTTIIFTTAYLDEAERCGRVTFLYKGKVLIEGTAHEVKGCLKGTILEVRCRAPRRAMLMLREKLGADCVKLFGNRIHIYIYTEEVSFSLGQVQEILLQAGLGDYEIRQTEPTLEDVFMSLMRKVEGEDADVSY